MSKSILILDTPKSCFFCRFRGEKPYYKQWETCGDKFCTLTEMDNEEYYYAAFQDNYIRPEWCPLIEVKENSIEHF